MLSLADAKDIGTLLGAVVAGATLIKGTWEFSRQAAQKRSDHFTAMRNRLKDNPIFADICARLEERPESLGEVPYPDRRNFLGFYEELALAMNSGAIRPAVVHYMFAYYAIRCWKNDSFWSDINRDSPYWLLFRDFAKAMIAEEARFSTSSAEAWARQLRF